MKLRGRTGQVHKITAMDRNWPDPVLLPQTAHCVTLRRPKRIRLPLPRAGGEYLERVGPQPISTLSGHFYPASGGSMYANLSRPRLRRLAFRPQQHILHAEPLPLWHGGLFPPGYILPATLWVP